MAEQNNVQTTKNEALKESFSFPIQDILRMILRNWYWFVISTTVCLVVAVLYVKRTAPVYHRSATILVKDSRKGGDMDITAFNDLSGVSTRRNIDNELYLLQSRRLMQTVVNKLNLTINYRTKGTFRMFDLYKRSPVEVVFINSIPQQSLGLTARVMPDSTVKLTAFQERNISEAQRDQVITARMGDTIATPIGELIVKPTIYLDDYMGRDILVSKGSFEGAVSAYRSAVSCSVVNKQSSVVVISMNNTVAQRAEDVINTLINAYNDDAIEEKRSVSAKTAQFIAERLEVVGRELGDVDRNIADFKKSNQLVNISADASRSLSESAKYKSESLELENQIQIALYVKEYLLDKNNSTSLIPNMAGINDASINSHISTYNTGVMRREKLASEASTNNPVINQIDREMAAIRQTIIAGLDSYISTLEMQLSTFRKEESLANSRISAASSQERAILSITRQQHIKEQLYLYLLNKREENELAYAITESNARIIDVAYGPGGPVAPKSSSIMFMALVIGLGIPFVIFYLLEMLNTSIRGRKDIEDNLSVPFLGDIPLYTGESDGSIVAVHENGRDSVSEAFRMMRSNMTFMNASTDKMKTILVTSSNPHAGKTFITMNLAMTLALTDKRVLVIDLDLRRRTLSKRMRAGKTQGITAYIAGKVENVNELIIPTRLHEKLDMIPAGHMPPNPAEMLLSKRIDTAIEALEKEYDYIFIDSVPAMNVADAIICDRLCDLCIYVVREGLLDKRQLPDIERLYREKKFHNMSIVLNGVTVNNRRYGYGYYGYGYGYGYGPEEDKGTIIDRLVKRTKRNK